MNLEKSNIQLINEKHQLATISADTAKAHVSTAIIAAWECGQLLIAEKSKCDYGTWLEWLAANCPTITTRTAQRYMELGRKYDSLSHLADAITTKSLQAVGMLPEPEPSTSEPRMSQPDQGLMHLQGICQWFAKHDPTKLNDVGRQAWKERLRPVVEVYERL